MTSRVVTSCVVISFVFVLPYFHYFSTPCVFFILLTSASLHLIFFFLLLSPPLSYCSSCCTFLYTSYFAIHLPRSPSIYFSCYYFRIMLFSNEPRGRLKLAYLYRCISPCLLCLALFRLLLILPTRTLCKVFAAACGRRSVFACLYGREHLGFVRAN